MRRRPATRQKMRGPYIAAGIAGVVIVIGLVVLLLGGGASTPTANSAAPTTRHVAQPVGLTPSQSAQMVCSLEAQKDLASALGVAATAVSTPTWAAHLYSCQYEYPTGSIGLSVKELSNRAETTSYFDSLRSRLGESEKLEGVAQGAFVTRDGDLVLRKDYKVLLVATAAVSVPFGSGLRTRAQVAIGVGVTVLGCWTGA